MLWFMIVIFFDAVRFACYIHPMTAINGRRTEKGFDESGRHFVEALRRNLPGRAWEIDVKFLSHITKC
jgi:hypothetical protein